MDETYTPAPSYDRLAQEEDGAPFFDRVEAAQFPDHILRYRNQRWARPVGLGGLSDDEWIDHFGRFKPLRDNFERPLAVRYHGHQFRSYNPDIGDGRGFLFAQLRDDQGRLLDLGTKGSGQTPYSRFGDGKLTLKGGVREVLATEMLEALGVYTSKTFSLIETGEKLYRNDEPSPTRSAVMVRLSHSHVRFGVFQRLSYEENAEAIERLVDYCVLNYFAALSVLEGEERVLAFYRAVVERTAKLTAQWMAAGFVHGVLNTDNMNVTGESFDYGPWRFAPIADPEFTAAYFDQTGLYAFGRQAEATAWNLAQFGGALARIADTDKLSDVLRGFGDAYEAAMADAYFARLGLKRSELKGDFDLATSLLRWMTQTGAPYKQVFFDWFGGPASDARARVSRIAELYERDDFAEIKAGLMAAAPDRSERLAHRYFDREKPTTMLIDEVEAIWDPIAADDDWSVFDQKLTDIADMREAHDFNASRYES